MQVREAPLFIGGRWVDGQAGGTFEVLNPATSEPIAVVPNGGADQAQATVDAAANAFPKWAAMTALRARGGFKESGSGREGGRQGIEEYMEVKSISLNIS